MPLKQRGRSVLDAPLEAGYDNQVRSIKRECAKPVEFVAEPS
jgi:hypothetical protein